MQLGWCLGVSVSLALARECFQFKWNRIDCAYVYVHAMRSFGITYNRFIGTRVLPALLTCETLNIIIASSECIRNRAWRIGIRCERTLCTPRLSSGVLLLCQFDANARIALAPLPAARDIYKVTFTTFFFFFFFVIRARRANIPGFINTFPGVYVRRKLEYRKYLSSTRRGYTKVHFKQRNAPRKKSLIGQVNGNWIFEKFDQLNDSSINWSTHWPSRCICMRASRFSYASCHVISRAIKLHFIMWVERYDFINFELKCSILIK